MLDARCSRLRERKKKEGKKKKEKEKKKHWKGAKPVTNCCLPLLSRAK